MHPLVSRTAIMALFAFLCTSLPSVADAQSQTYTDPVTGMEFVYIPGGTFTMGSDNNKDASPEHLVTVPAFYMGVYEVTFDQYAAYTNEFPIDLPDDNGWGQGNRPVINVNWHGAKAFMQWLSSKTGKTYRLPTEAEWEYAARGGMDTLYPWGDTKGTNMANCRDCGSPWDNKMTAPVGSFQPNGYGLFDMSGNVYEWTSDFKHPNYEGAPTDGSAWTDSPTYRWAQLRVTRGGSFKQRHQELRSFVRCWDGSTDRTKEIGFRVVLEP